MKIVACGPESSGTRLLSRIVATSGLPVLHRSMPHGSDWTLPLEPADRMVVVTRHPVAVVGSAVAAGHASDRLDAQDRLDRALTVLHGYAWQVPSYWLAYEDLGDPDALVRLSGWLGRHVYLLEEMRDGNARWLE